MKILVVDDSLTMRKIIINTLGKLGYNDVIEATDGKDALSKIYSEKIEFIITDWNMPEMNGHDFVKAVREDAAFKEIPILMVSTTSMKEDIVAALKVGVNNYIVKPFEPKVLEKKLNEIFKK